MNVGEIFIKLGFHADTFTLKDFSKSLGELPMKAVSTMLGIAGVSLEIGNLINKAMDAASGFQMFTAMTGQSSHELQRWQLVAKQVGMTGQEVASSFLGVNAAKSAILAGHGAEQARAFGLLHVPWRNRSIDQIMQDLRHTIAKMDPTQKLRAESWLGGIGVDVPSMMRLAQMPDKEFNARAGAVGTMDSEQIEAAARLKTAFVILAETIEHVIVEPMKDLAEILKDLTPILREWLPATYHAMKSMDNPENNPGRIAREYLEGDLKGFMNLLTFHPWKEPAYVVPRIGSELNLQQYIYSTSSPEEVARFAIAEAARKRTQATKHFGNTGI